MGFGYDASAEKRSVSLLLNDDLVAKVTPFVGDLSETIERLLAGFVADREAALKEAIEHWNEYDARHGSFADEYIDL